MIKNLTMFLDNVAKFNIAKIIAKKIEKVKSSLSPLPMNTKLILKKLVLIKFIH